jgi:hypothetical protein
MKFKRTPSVEYSSNISEPSRYKKINSRLITHDGISVNGCNVEATHNRYHIKTTIEMDIEEEEYNSNLLLINSRLFVGDTTCPKDDIGTIDKVTMDGKPICAPPTEFPIKITIVSFMVKELPITNALPTKPLGETLYNVTSGCIIAGNLSMEQTFTITTKTNTHEKGTPYRAPIAGYRKVLCDKPYGVEPIKTVKPGCYDTRIRSGMQPKEVKSSEKKYSYSYPEYNKNRVQNTYDSNWNPSNDKFKVQGAVSSGGRIERLKLDTLRATNSKCERGARCDKYGEGKGVYFAGNPRFDGHKTKKNCV